MDINTATAGVWTVISVSGEIDLHHSTDLRIEIIRHLDDGESVLLDMANVSYISTVRGSLRWCSRCPMRETRVLSLRLRSPHRR